MLVFSLNIKPQISPKFLKNMKSIPAWAFLQLKKGKRKLVNQWGDCITLKDRITCWQGDKLQFSTKGHFVSYGLIMMTNLLSFTGASSISATGMLYSSSNYNLATAQGNWYAKVGTGTGSTIQSTVALVTPVATLPSYQWVVTSNPTAGSYRIAYTFTWNSGTLSAITITEFGLWMNNGTVASPTVPALSTFGATSIANTTNPQFMGRISSTDSDFASFTVNTSVPLTLQWNLTFTYA